MNLQEFLTRLDRERRKKLAEAQTAEELNLKARELGYELTEKEAEEVFAALYPVRGGKVDDDALSDVFGGWNPRPSVPTVFLKAPTIL